MPVLTIAAACARTAASSIVLPKWFQLFHPMGGVCASWALAASELQTITKRTKHCTVIVFFLGSMFSFLFRASFLTKEVPARGRSSVVPGHIPGAGTAGSQA